MVEIDDNQSLTCGETFVAGKVKRRQMNFFVGISFKTS